MRRWLLTLAIGAVAAAVGADEATNRLLADREAGKPLVVHVVVALCDNVHQGIVPVPARLGNGSDPDHNLYWGAAYGMRSYFGRSTGWKRVSLERRPSPGILERVVFSAKVKGARAFIVAEAWEGSRIREAISRFLEMAAGRQAEVVQADGEALPAGGQAHVLAFVGHNGLMDFAPPSMETGVSKPGRAAMVLACASRPYFKDLLGRSGAYPLLLTTGLMAPEAYSLEAAVREWFATADPSAARAAAANAYDRYQKCGRRAAGRLFSVDVKGPARPPMERRRSH